MLPRRTQMRGAERSSAGSSLGSWTLELCLGKEEAGVSTVVEKFLIMELREISPVCKNSLGNTIGAPKTEEKKLPQPGKDHCLPSARSPRSTKVNSSNHVTAAARARSASLRQGCSLSTVLYHSSQDDKQLFVGVRC
jgi:hypothetical protein